MTHSFNNFLHLQITIYFIFLFPKGCWYTNKPSYAHLKSTGRSDLLRHLHPPPLFHRRLPPPPPRFHRPAAARLCRVVLPCSAFLKGRIFHPRRRHRPSLPGAGRSSPGAPPSRQGDCVGSDSGSSIHFAQIGSERRTNPIPAVGTCFWISIEARIGDGHLRPMNLAR